VVSNFVAIFVLLIVLGLIVANIVKIIFAYKNRKEFQAYKEDVDEKLKELGAQLQHRAEDLQEATNIINKEYRDVVAQMEIDLASGGNGDKGNKGEGKVEDEDEDKDGGEDEEVGSGA